MAGSGLAPLEHWDAGTDTATISALIVVDAARNLALSGSYSSAFRPANLMAAWLRKDVKAPSAVESRKALTHLVARTEAQSFAAGAAHEMKRLIDTRDERQRSEAEEILQLRVIKPLRQAVKLSSEEFVFMAGKCMYDLRDRKLEDGSYDKQLRPIADRIDAIERKAGLAQDQFWLRGEARPNGRS